MGKAGADFDPEGYAPVADRIRLFYQAYPSGRILTTLVSRTDRDVVFEARVYRTADDREPAATGWAAEREGDGDVNTVACLENTETSAIGRALANLGFTASRLRPSAEEIAKAHRVRARLAIARVAERPTSPQLLIADLVHLIDRAERAGLRPVRAARWRMLLTGGPVGRAMPPALLLRCEDRLRRWIARRRPHIAE